MPRTGGRIAPLRQVSPRRAPLSFLSLWRAQAGARAVASRRSRPVRARDRAEVKSAAGAFFELGENQLRYRFERIKHTDTGPRHGLKLRHIGRVEHLT